MEAYTKLFKASKQPEFAKQQLTNQALKQLSYLKTILDTPTPTETASESRSKASTKVFSRPITEITFDHVDGLSDDLLEFIEHIRMYPDLASKIRITSGYRPGATTSNGSTSYHATGDAIDIVPTDGNFDTLKAEFLKYPDLITFMQERGIGVFEETDQKTLNKTGGTGPHWHIGKDNVAVQGLKRMTS